jgi:2'-5' RNA ligase
MRLFVATPVTLPFYQSLKNDLSSFIKGKFVEAYNLHLTHLFIGEDEPEKWQKNIIVPNEKIIIQGFGKFKNVLYLKVTSKNIDLVSKQFNNKNFIPHITICRFKELKDGYEEILKKYEKFKIEAPFEVWLYSSVLTSKGPIYKKLYKYQ